METQTVNAYESAGRLRKVAALVVEFDRRLNAEGHNPHAAPVAAESVRQLRRAPPELWAELSAAIGIKAPSAKTIALVIETYQTRVQR